MYGLLFSVAAAACFVFVVLRLGDVGLTDALDVKYVAVVRSPSAAVHQQHTCNLTDNKRESLEHGFRCTADAVLLLRAHVYVCASVCTRYVRIDSSVLS